MSWDAGERILKIKSSENSLKGIVKIVKNIEKKNKKLFNFNIELFDDYGFLNIIEKSMYKYGCFSFSGRYNFEQFIDDIIMSDKENILLKYVNMDLYKFEDTNNYKEFIDKISRKRIN